MTSSKKASIKSEITAMPSWLRRPIGKASELSTVQRIIKQRQIHTICEEGRCPNRGECYRNETASFLLMGPTCTRACAFCDIKSGRPLPLDWQEPQRLAEAVRAMNLRHVVITSVNRDEREDGGAPIFAACIAKGASCSPAAPLRCSFLTSKGALTPLKL